jgi:hypothetical protein
MLNIAAEGKIILKLLLQYVVQWCELTEHGRIWVFVVTE